MLLKLQLPPPFGVMLRGWVSQFHIHKNMSFQPAPFPEAFSFNADPFLQNPETLLTPAAPTIQELPSLDAPGPSSWESSFPIAIFVKKAPK